MLVICVEAIIYSLIYKLYHCTLKRTKSTDNANQQKISNNKQDSKLVIKFQIQKNIKKSKCKSRRGAIYKVYLPKRFSIQSMEDKYFHSGVTIELPENGLLCYLHFKGGETWWLRYMRGQMI